MTTIKQLIYSNKFYINKLRKNGLKLQFVPYQTEYLCLEAVKQNGLALQFVHKQTIELCLAAVRQNGLALELVNDEFQIPEIILPAIKQNKNAIDFIKNKEQKEILMDFLLKIREIKKI